MINIKTNFGSGVFTWTKEYMIQLLTTGKNPVVTNPLLINALTEIDRADFVPERLKRQAYIDVELNIGFGESLTKPTTLFLMLNKLNPDVGQKILDLGSGTGYSATILGHIASKTGSVFSLERVQ